MTETNKKQQSVVKTESLVQCEEENLENYANITETQNKPETQNKVKAQETTQNKTENTLLSKGEENQQQKFNIKKLSFWLGLLAVLIVGVQMVLNYFGVEFEAKIVIEVCSYLLALLCSIGVLKGSFNSKNIVETKEQIETELNKNITKTQQNKSKAD